MALLYDVVAILAIVMVVGLLCQLATGGQLITTGPQVHIAWWYRPLQALVVATYFLLSWLRGGQTLGMRPWRIRLTGRHGSPISPRQALVRLIVAAMPLLLLLLAPCFGLRLALWAVLGGWVIGFGAALFDPGRRAVHDLVAGTELHRFG